MDELTDYRLNDLTTHLEKLTDKLTGYVESNERRITSVETTQKNFKWLIGAFGAIMIIINLTFKLFWN